MTGAPAVVLGDRYADAVRYATAVHAAQSRKGTAVPYAAHLLGVSAIVLEAGGDEDQAIAGLLHDAAEDHGGRDRLADIEARFGARVAAIVDACSDSLEAEGAPKAGWEERKRAHLERLREADPDALLVWGADKVHNARAIVTDVDAHGPGVLGRFSAPPDRLLWYYAANLELLADAGLPSELVVTLRSVVTALAERLDPGAARA